jgi:hypothetical protein
MCCPAKSLHILHEISEQIGVMGDRHRQEYVSSINQNLDKNDDFPGLELDHRSRAEEDCLQVRDLNMKRPSLKF